MTSIVLKSFIPEVFLSLCILLQLVFNSNVLTNIKNYNRPLLDKELFSQLGFVLLCVFLLQSNSLLEGHFNNFLFANDFSTQQTKIIFIVTCLISIPIVCMSFQDQKINFFEFFSLFLLAILSLMLLISSCDLLTFYLTLEMQSLCFYVLACFRRNSSFSTDSGLKYFISGSFISGVFLFGCSLVYLVLGTLNLNSIHLIFSVPFVFFELHFVLLVGIVFITSIILFKITCAPLHFWAPDVYEGAPLSATITFSIIPKLPLFFFFVRWILSLGVFHESILQILLYSGLFSLILGTVFAVVQRRFKRLIIYSSIAQIGFLVCALSLGHLEGTISMYFFLIIYLLTSVLIWGHFVVFYMSQNKTNTFISSSQTPLFITSLCGLNKYNSIFSFSLLIIFFSIAGIPPLAGFLSKVLIVSTLVKNNYIVGGILLMIVSSLSVFYYIRVIKLVYFEPNINIISLENYQISHQGSLFDNIYLVFSFLVFLLLILFFEPNLLILGCEGISLDSILL